MVSKYGSLVDVQERRLDTVWCDIVERYGSAAPPKPPKSVAKLDQWFRKVNAGQAYGEAVAEARAILSAIESIRAEEQKRS